MNQILINGTISGLCAGVLALAFTIVYLPTGVFHIALGAVYAAAPFIAWDGMHHGWPAPVAVVIAVACAVILSALCELINHWPLARRRNEPGAHMIASLGVYMIVVQLLAWIWGSETRMLFPGQNAAIRVHDVLLSRAQMVSAMLAVAALVIFYVVLWTTKAGLQLRALSDNRKEFGLRGFNARITRLWTFMASGLLVSIVALANANDIGFDPDSGLETLLVAVAATIIGGRASFVGPALGGLLVGVVRTELAWYLSARWQDTFTYVVLVIFLFMRPKGLIGRPRRLEAET
ncbi:MAG: branched-chain amino acid ABC transporter permease [Armatimonadetes bacterium]|nr:branched-chain amino acid ABC transporter permease [Armatimonadota bacterium]